MPRHLLELADLTADEIGLLLDTAEGYAEDPLLDHGVLTGRTVVLYFNKPSTRTRLSMASAVVRLGGTPLTVGPDALQLGRGETIEDTARVISSYADLFAVRTYADDDVQRFAGASSIPVVNALTDLHHPCQALADLLTLRQTFGGIEGCRIAWVGDGNNVCHSLIEAAAILGLELHVATPAALAPNALIVQRALKRAAESGAKLTFGTDPREAAEGAHAIYTDTWVSMGDPEDEKDRRMELLEPYQVDGALMQLADPDGIFMHCLPDHRGHEVTAEVVDGPRSRVFQQACNRLPTATALFRVLVRGELEEP